MSGEVFEFSDVQSGGRVDEIADVVIIGSGASGATAARVLTEAGLDVILVEEGSVVPPKDRHRDAWGSFKQLWRDAGFQVAEGRSFTPILQGTAVGGSTVVYGAIVHRMPEPILDRWSKEFGIDERYSLDELTRVYDKLDVELSVAPAPEEVLGGNNERMRAGCDGMGIASHPIRRNVKGCRGSVRCLQGCPTGQKQGMDVTFIPRSVDRGARVYANCRADRIALEGTRAGGVHGRFIDPDSGRPGPVFFARARQAVLIAASAVQTPLLLGASGVRDRARLLGRRFQGHPGSSVLGVFDEPVNMWFGATQGYETTHWWAERMKMESVGVPLEIGASRLPGFGSNLIERIARFGHIGQWGVQVRAQAMGRVRKTITGRTKITYSMTPEDVAVMKLGTKRLIRMNFEAGASAVYPGIPGLPERIESPDDARLIDDLPDDPRLFHCIVSHLFGTAMMGPDPASSVVGLDAQVHGTQGLYVVDSSIFPTNMGVNPAHTISAMAWLIAEQIAGA